MKTENREKGAVIEKTKNKQIEMQTDNRQTEKGNEK
jgi:hypothetical protein